MPKNPTFPLLLALSVQVPSAPNLQGVVTDLVDHPLAGVLVIATGDRQSTGTDSLGRWEIASAGTGIGRRIPSAIPTDARPSLEPSALRWEFAGRDAGGRRSSHREVRTSTKAPATAARSLETAPESLLLAWNGRVRSRIALATFPTAAILKIDTSATNADVPWNPSISYQNLVDSRDHQVYRTVSIGSLTWMAQNLNFRNLSGKPDSVGVWYQGDADSGAKYGRLYTWAEAVDGQRSAGDLKGICPDRWHLPSEREWEALRIAVDSGDAVAGQRLKSSGGWPFPNEGVDLHGFRALPAGSCTSSDCHGAGTYGIWRSTADYDLARASVRVLSAGSAAIASPRDAVKSGGYSIRCIKD